MSEIATSAPLFSESMARKALKGSAAFWFSVAAVGHWIFLYYIVWVFGPMIMSHGLEGLADSHLPSGFREGDTIGNLAALSHVLLAALIIGGGPLQLIPAIRNRFPTFHRYLGRSYLIAAVTSSIGGLYMVWTRGSVGNVINHIGISGDAVLIIAFAFMAVRYAIARDIRRHRRWAMRLFLVASAVWFFRIGLMGWVMLTGGAGVDFETFTGPFIYTLGFAQYLVPLAFLEMYFWAKEKAGTTGKLITAGTLSILALLTGFGIFAATMGLWLPRL